MKGFVARPVHKEQTMRYIVVAILITLSLATATSNCTPSSSSPAPSQTDRLNGALKERLRKAEERRRAVQEPLDELKEADRKKAIEYAKWRTWTSAGGGFRVEAKFVKSANGTVTLEKKDGRSITVRTDQLTPDDQDFIKNRKWLQAPP